MAQQGDTGLSPEATDRLLQAHRNQLRHLASELSLTEARERRKIASDLHDHIGQALAFVVQKVSILQGNAIFSGMDDDFSEILSILRQTIRYTRDLTVEISPPVLYELGLPAALDWLADRTLQRHGLRIAATQSGAPSPIAEDISVFAFKAVQELITNVVKHADASQVEIHAYWRESDFEIVVSDNGGGFEPRTLGSDLHGDCCFGLFSIRERLSYVGGTLEIDSSPGHGTRVSITAPNLLAPEAEYGGQL
jgi:signal transduction histidine kinase